MKAIVHTAYGPPDELQLVEVEKPAPRDDQVLVKIYATAVTSSDCNVRNLTFCPTLFLLPMRMQFGLRKPKVSRLGIDLAGEIEAVGRDVRRFKPGDQVFGRCALGLGAHAEYICLPEDGTLAMKPANVSWAEAAALPFANTALYYLRDLGNVRAGQKVLINGASGSIGTFAVQLAKHYGADVTGICSTINLDMVESLGADRVIDYTKVDPAGSGETYDLIFDAVGKLPYSRCKASLKRDAVYLAVLPTLATILQAAWSLVAGTKKVRFGDAVATVENLGFLKELTEAGSLKAIMDRSYPLEQIAEAFRYVEAGHKKGNVVVAVVPSRQT